MRGASATGKLLLAGQEVILPRHDPIRQGGVHHGGRILEQTVVGLDLTVHIASFKFHEQGLGVPAGLVLSAGLGFQVS